MIWNNQPPYPATLSPTAPTTAPIATFTATSFDFDVPGGGNSTIGGFFASSASPTSLTCAASDPGCAGYTNLNDTYEFTGTAYLTAGTTYYFNHDDGMYLYLDGSLVINSGAPTTEIASDFTVATSGAYNFEVLYTNVNALPSVLESNVAPTPEPTSIALLGSSLLGLAGAVRRRLKK